MRPDGVSLRIAPAQDGLFYLSGCVEGAPVRFLIETGASVVVLSRADAQWAGFRATAPPATAQVEKANVASTMTSVKLSRLGIGGRELRNVTVAVAPGNLNVSLVGIDLLTKLGPLTLDDGHMRVSRYGTGGRPRSLKGCVPSLSIALAWGRAPSDMALSLRSISASPLSSRA
jgi:clan AA aspartic protease (TIGR02281 family)